MDDNRNNSGLGENQFGSGNENNQQNAGWVFSGQGNPEDASNRAARQSSEAGGYDSKYSYSSYHGNPNQGEASRQPSGQADQAFPSKEAESYKWNYEDYQMHQQPKGEPKQKKNKGLKVFAMIMCAILCAGVVPLAGYGVFSMVSGPMAPTEEQPAASAGTGDELHLTLTDKPQTDATVLADGKLSIPDRASKVLPSVVGIVVYMQDQNVFSGQQGQGSGIVASQDGYIVTNAHVVSGAATLKVVMHDGTEYTGTVVGEDTKTDLAVIKVDATGLTAAEFGNSEQLQVGEQVITIGNPGGLELAGSITVGYVSALNRPIATSSTGSTVNCIQTDAAINLGNSGGALVNEFGQVIGINSQKIAATEYEGIGFAISINDAQPIINDLIAHGYVTGRVKLGITAVEIDAYAAQIYGGYKPGIGINTVEPGTPAASSGLTAGDVITAIDGTEVATFQELNTILEKHKVGDTVSLTVFRKSLQSNQADKNLTIKVQLIEAGKAATTSAEPQVSQDPQNPLIPQQPGSGQIIPKN